MFHSKGALLVVFWMALLWSTLWSFLRLYEVLFQGIQYTGFYSSFAFIPAVPFLIFAPLLGWFADTRFGYYKVFKAGVMLTFLATVLACVCVLILENVSKHGTVSRVLSGGVSLFVYIVAAIGLMSCILPSFQLGLDQMPDASPANITSFIAWMVFSLGGGCWIADFLFFMIKYCCFEDKTFVGYQVFSLYQVCCMSIVCCSLFLFGKKWLIIEPKSSQSLKTIYQVLKFAAKHKAPLNRSALTYWEENVPSRIDLGKSRYGGPFTTEQVEDVKTFFKILAVSLPVFASSSLLKPNQILSNDPVVIPSLSDCTSRLVYPFSYSPWFWVVVISFCNEFVIYPLFRNKLPNILTSIGIANFIVLLVQVGYLIANVADLFHHLHKVWWHWPFIIFCITFGLIIQLTLTKLTEFACAQSPYNMRGLLAGYVGFLYLSAVGVGVVLFTLLNIFSHGPYHKIIRNCTETGLSLIGFILHCLLAHWYKRRVRDEEYNVHRVVEEVYNRYLSNAH